MKTILTCLNTFTLSRWSFSLNILPLVRAPIASGHYTKNIWQPMQREDFDSLQDVRWKNLSPRTGRKLSENDQRVWPSFLNLDGLCGRFTRLRAEGVTVKLFTRFQTYAGTCDGAYVFVFLNRNAKHSIIQFPLISQS